VAFAGEVIDDPITGQRITFLKTSADTEGELLRFEMRLAPGGFVPAHMHPIQRERLEVISGSLNFRTQGSERILHSGDVLFVTPKEGHEARNDSAEEACFVIETRPALRTEKRLEIIAGLAQRAKESERGSVGHLIQRGVIAHAYLKETALPGVPFMLQEATFAFLAELGRLCGYSPEGPAPAATGRELK
jgi:quercetin dioxygenase-like cupin family protein